MPSSWAMFGSTRAGDLSSAGLLCGRHIDWLMNRIICGSYSSGLVRATGPSLLSSNLPTHHPSMWLYGQRSARLWLKSRVAIAIFPFTPSTWRMRQKSIYGFSYKIQTSINSCQLPFPSFFLLIQTIKPLEFSLENQNPIALWRTTTIAKWNQNSIAIKWREEANATAAN